MEHNEVEFKMKSTSWQGCNLWENNAVEFFDLTGKADSGHAGPCFDPHDRAGRRMVEING
jgi:hypothetical protein